MILTLCPSHLVSVLKNHSNMIYGKPPFVHRIGHISTWASWASWAEDTGSSQTQDWHLRRKRVTFLALDIPACCLAGLFAFVRVCGRFGVKFFHVNKSWELRDPYPQTVQIHPYPLNRQNISGTQGQDSTSNPATNGSGEAKNKKTMGRYGSLLFLHSFPIRMVRRFVGYLGCVFWYVLVKSCWVYIMYCRCIISVNGGTPKSQKQDHFDKKKQLHGRYTHMAWKASPERLGNRKAIFFGIIKMNTKLMVSIHCLTSVLGGWSAKQRSMDVHSFSISTVFWGTPRTGKNLHAGPTRDNTLRGSTW